MSIAKHTKTVKWQENSSGYTFLQSCTLNFIKCLKFGIYPWGEKSMRLKNAINNKCFPSEHGAYQGQMIATLSRNSMCLFINRVLPKLQHLPFYSDCEFQRCGVARGLVREEGLLSGKLWSQMTICEMRRSEFPYHVCRLWSASGMDFFCCVKGKHYLIRQTDSVRADTVVSEQSFLKLTFSVISKLVIAMGEQDIRRNVVPGDISKHHQR